MIRILTIDTSTEVCTVALHENGKLINAKISHGQKTHSTHLTVLAESLLHEVNLTLQDVDAFAISKGPGSYTGLRVGVATVKGYCFALEKPMLSVNTLDGMWQQVKEKVKANYYVPMIDARRMEVYTNIFDTNGAVSNTEALVLDEHSFAQYLEKGVVAFFGNGSAKFADLLKNHQNAQFIPDIFPDASFMGKQVFSKFEKQAFEDVAYFEPFYLKDFVATTPKKAVL